MKVFFDYQIFTYQRVGGISRYFVNLANELQKRNIDVSVNAGLHSNDYLRQPYNFKISGAYVESVFNSRYESIARHGFNYLLNQFQELSSHIDIIHETYYSGLPRISNKPRVLTVYDMIHELYSAEFGKGDRTRVRKEITFNSVDKIICISNSTKNDLVNLYNVEEEKISVVYLGVDSSKFKKKGCTTRIHSFDYILYVGARKGYKNFILLLKAFAVSSLRLIGIKLVVFGGGEFTIEELSVISSLGLSDDTIILVSGNDDLLAKYYQNACFFVYPSLYEGFGIPPLEAMACGCPVLVSFSSSIPEVVGDAGLYFEPQSLESLVDGLERMLLLNRNSQIDLGFGRVKHFTWEKCAISTLDVYNKLL